MRDFTPAAYRALLTALKEEGYGFQTVAGFLTAPRQKTVILRHDVDKKPRNALQLARLEAEFRIFSTYYFRTVPGVFAPEIIREIASLDHEVGYHYENLSAISKKEKGKRKKEGIQETGKQAQETGDRRQETGKRENLINLAIMDFEKNLEKLRAICPVQTICMHGSPLSPRDNRELWEHTDYRQYGIIGEPYLDIDFDRVLYLTDTGRRWDGGKVSVRDKVKSKKEKGKKDPSFIQQNHYMAEDIQGKRKKEKGKKDPSFIQQNHDMAEDIQGKKKKEKGKNNLSFHRTWDIIRAAEKNHLPDQIMINIHPQRWEERVWPWLWEGVSQKVKNGVKRFVLAHRRKKYCNEGKSKK